MKKVYFIGIGGVGMSAAAWLAKSWGCEVVGSDQLESEHVRRLQEVSIWVEVGPPSASRISDDVDVVVYSNAIGEDHVERVAAAERGLPQKTYYQFIGELVRDLGKHTVAVAGMHGKTTTTSMLASMYKEAGLDPSVLVGSVVEGLEFGNAHAGAGDDFLVEADEYAAGLLGYYPDTLLLLNIDEEHLDYYRDLAHIKETFEEFVERVPEDGMVVVNADDSRAMGVVSGARARVVTFGLEEGPQYQAIDVVTGSDGVRFRVMKGGEYFAEIGLSRHGKHNVSNALGAFVVAVERGVEPRVAVESLRLYQGAARRFEVVGWCGSTRVIDDYAHHPREIAATVKAYREAFPSAKLGLAVQFHQVARVRSLKEDFVQALVQASELCDRIWVTDVYVVEGRDEVEFADEVSAENMVKLARDAGARDGVLEVAEFDGLADILRAECGQMDSVMTMGAGSITEIAHAIVDTK